MFRILRKADVAVLARRNLNRRQNSERLTHHVHVGTWFSLLSVGVSVKPWGSSLRTALSILKSYFERQIDVMRMIANKAINFLTFSTYLTKKAYFRLIFL